MDNRTDASIIQERYKKGLQFQKEMKFTDKWPEYERFKGGDQWPAATEATKNLPRPVFNIIDYIENHKTASVMNENVKMTFSSTEVPDERNEQLQAAAEGSDKFTKMSEVTWEDIQQDSLNEDVLDSASNLGTGFTHYYMDIEASGGITMKWKGKLAGEDIDPMNIFFDNPQCRILQKQPGITISKRDTVKSIREEVKKNGTGVEDINAIVGDKNTKEEGYDAAQHELSGEDKCTVLIRYERREDGYIWLCKVCGNITVKPWVSTRKKLYPIAAMVWKKRKKCIFGIGDTEGLIPNQKGINFLLAMMLLSAQGTAWPKLIAKAGALQQTITNTPGEIITDMLGNPGLDNIKYMQPGNFSSATFALVDKFVDLTKQFSSAQDAATGDVNSQNNTATGIMLLQKAAGVPLEKIKRNYYKYLEDVGRIWEEFYKVDYNLERPVKFKDADGNEYPDTFLGSNYADDDMCLKIDIGPSTQYSEALMMQSLDKFYDKKEIDIMDYLELAPKNVIPFKDRLKKILEKKKQDALNAGNGMQSDESALDKVVQSLSPEEMMMVKQDPQLQEEILNRVKQNMEGGMPNEMPGLRQGIA